MIPQLKDLELSTVRTNRAHNFLSGVYIVVITLVPLGTTETLVRTVDPQAYCRNGCGPSKVKRLRDSAFMSNDHVVTVSLCFLWNSGRAATR